MAIRLLTSFGTGAVVTFLLLWIMQILIATGKEALTDKDVFSFVDFVRVKQEELVEQKKLPVKLVVETFHYARQKRTRHPFQYFQRALVLRAGRLGVKIRTV